MIDPELAYSTFLGGSGNDHQWSLAVDRDGNANVAGQTMSPNFPTTPGAFDSTYAGVTEDALVAKMNPTGSGLVYATYLGGDAWDSGQDITTDGEGNAYLFGYTQSASFPVTRGRSKPIARGFDDNFVVKLSASGSLQYSTLIGGSGAPGVGNSESQIGAIAVDGTGHAFATAFTTSVDFPTTPGAYDPQAASPGRHKAYVTKLNPNGTGLAYSTLLGPAFQTASWWTGLETRSSPGWRTQISQRRRERTTRRPEGTATCF